MRRRVRRREHLNADLFGPADSAAQEGDHVSLGPAVWKAPHQERAADFARLHAWRRPITHRDAEDDPVQRLHCLLGFLFVSKCGNGLCSFFYQLWVHRQRPEHFKLCDDLRDQLGGLLRHPVLWKAGNLHVCSCCTEFARAVALSVTRLATRMAPPVIAGAIFLDVAHLSTQVALRMDNGHPAFWVLEDTFRPSALRAKVAHALGRVFLQLPPSRVDIEATLPLAFAAKATNKKLRVILNLAPLRVRVVAVNLLAATPEVARFPAAPFSLFHALAKLLHDRGR
mmetsp:Transcript_49929/g.128840  ORF Transcript_49929/g.128840 Transcript_49929/m.128840 type:complete len:283 (+) Transcript_49929:1324-2172(+)